MTAEQVRARIAWLNEAICRCTSCRGTIDRAKLCRVCRVHDAEIGCLRAAYLRGNRLNSAAASAAPQIAEGA